MRRPWGPPRCPGPLGRRRPDTRGGPRRRPQPAHLLPRTLPASRLPRRTADQCHARPPRPPQRPAAQDCEPIAIEAGLQRKLIPFFVDAGPGDDEGVRAELRRHVREERADDRAILILDPGLSPRRGPRRAVWRGHGAAGWVSRTTASAESSWPRPPPAGMRRGIGGWTGSRTGRPTRAATPNATSPRGAEFPEAWWIATALLERCRTELPHAWVPGDDEFGRPVPFRVWWRPQGERHVRDGPRATVVRALECRRPRRRVRRGPKRAVPFGRVET
jgi:hypothetical protein